MITINWNQDGVDYTVQTKDYDSAQQLYEIFLYTGIDTALMEIIFNNVPYPTEEFFTEKMYQVWRSYELQRT